MLFLTFTVHTLFIYILSKYDIKNLRHNIFNFISSSDINLINFYSLTAKLRNCY